MPLDAGGSPGNEHDDLTINQCDTEYARHLLNAGVKCVRRVDEHAIMFTHNNVLLFVVFTPSPVISTTEGAHC